MPTIELTLPNPHEAQRRIIQEAGRFNVICLGRRSGKTVLGIDRVIETVLMGYPAGWFSPTYKMLSDVWREIVATLQPVTKRVNGQEHRIELITGGIVDMWSLDDPNVARGRKYKRVVIDEAAMVARLQEAWQQVIRPTLADYGGDAWFLSTPKGHNFFYTLYRQGLDEAYPDWRCWQMPTRCNPYIKLSEIDDMRREQPERAYLQEIEAVFLEDGGGVLRKVRHAATATPIERAVPGRSYVAGVDWGRTNDATVITVMDMEAQAVVYCKRLTDTSYPLQKAILKEVNALFQPVTIIAEYNSMGGPQIEDLQNEDVPVRPFVTSNATKAQIIDALALAFEMEQIRILDDPLAIAEYEAYESKRTPSGLVQYSAPEGMHDDHVMSLALAWYACNRGGLMIAFG